MNTNTKVAVITPTHNGDVFIKNAIDSVKRQSFTNITHYIYDDASTDNTDEILSQYHNSPNIKIITGTVNQGQSYGRNYLIEQAINDGCTYVAFLDADDRWDSNHVESSLASLEENDIVYSLPRFVLEDGNSCAPVNIPVPKTFIGKQLYHNNFIWISSVVADINLFSAVPFDSDLDSVEDWDMWIRQFELGRKFVRKEETSVTYTVRASGSAGRGGEKTALFNRKNRRLLQLKLHLACGHDYKDDYINVDLYPTDGAVTDAQFDVAVLPYDDNTVDEIRAFHIIEHFDWHQGQRTLEEWYRVLKPGGRLWLETPDFLASCDAFVKGTPEFRNLLYGHFFAMPWIPGQTHKFLFTEDQLRCQLDWAGFKRVNRLPPASNYVRPDTYNLFLNVEAFK